MKPLRVLVALFLLCALPAFAAAETLSGTVNNATTNKPAVGDDVVLIKLAQGMEEVARTKADGHGKFSFDIKDPGGPHLIRVVHQGVTYNEMATPGTTSMDVDVYDVSKKLAGVSVTADVMRFQAQGNELQGVRLFAVDNKSQPPRTQMNDQNFEFYLPEGAELDQGMAMTAGGEPINSAPVPQKEKNCYAFIFPLRPGETQFQVTFHMPYSGQLSIDPKAIYGSQHFVVMLPKTMQFTAGLGTAFQAMKDPRDPDAVVQVASNTVPGQPLSFTIAGTGVMTNQNGGGQAGDAQAGGAQGGDAQASGAMQDESRPGGGLGPPIDAPDPLEHYRWYILGGFALVLAAGAIYIAKRPQPAHAVHFSGSDTDVEIPEPAVANKKRSSGGSSSMLLEALKDEIFQLEVEHKQGRISQSEYEKAKAALDQTLERAIKRASNA
jgi:hypothetical protein